MTDNEIIKIAKVDLQISTNALDEYIGKLIEFAKAAITKEGIKLQNNIEDGMLVEMYTAYLYRKRRDGETGMPRMLRYALNNRLLGQKAKE